jgi:hypothetical protein
VHDVLLAATGGSSIVGLASCCLSSICVQIKICMDFGREGYTGAANAAHSSSSSRSCSGQPAAGMSSM